MANPKRVAPVLLPNWARSQTLSIQCSINSSFSHCRFTGMFHQNSLHVYRPASSENHWSRNLRFMDEYIERLLRAQGNGERIGKMGQVLFPFAKSELQVAFPRCLKCPLLCPW